MKNRWWFIAIQLIIWCVGVPPLLLFMAAKMPCPIVSSVMIVVTILISGYLFNFKPKKTLVRNIVRVLIYLICMTAITALSGFLFFWGMFFYSVIFLNNPL